MIKIWVLKMQKIAQIINRYGFASLRVIQDFCDEYKSALGLTAFLHYFIYLPDRTTIFSLTVRTDREDLLTF